ncbi:MULTISPECIES: hypothetical protein [Streptomyces]|uniref:Potassium/proton antiporter subunit KhtT-like N-terminal domain-containing protein n=2 Tax=Streptomyces TaxID=1883 RepID=A0A100Y2V4_9ACTN|nr:MULTISPECIES: hypothetical protein [Streptomyces]KUH36615.1 hypothetical protein ATE80_22700 [Streptomyces kanasensis]UUS33566.1 potassium transporter TrkA [Streptomyces changanensis]
MGPRRTPLPGVGTQYDLITAGSRHHSAVVRRDGRRHRGCHRADDRDAHEGGAARAPDAAPARLLARAPAAEAGTDGTDLVTAHVALPHHSPHPGRLPRDTRARARTGAPGAPVGDIPRRPGAHPAPVGDVRPVGDVPVVVGTREGVAALTALVGGE